MTPVLAAGLILLAGAALSLTLPGNRARAWAAIGTQAIATALILAVVIPIILGGAPISVEWSWPFPFEAVRVRVDALGAFFLAWSLPMTLLGSVYALGYLQPYFDKGRNGGPHFALLNVTSLSFLMVYTVENALVFLLGWEIAAVAAWLLVIWDFRNQKIRFAGFNYLVSTHVGMFFLVAAFMVMHSQTGSFDFSAFSQALHRPGTMRNATFVLLVTSFGLKSAFFPFHTWLPRAHSAAPAHVSALMSGVIHKAGLFALLRFILLMGTPEEWMGWYLIGFSALSAVLGVLYTSSQRDLKRLLGYSSTENVGIAGLGFGVGVLGLCWHQPVLVLLGFTGGILHLFNHALFKCLLFYAAGAVYLSTHTIDIERLGGLARRMPWAAAFFLIGGLAISGLPPLNGFVSEFILYSGLLSDAVPSGEARALLICVAALLAFVGAVSALSMTRAFGVTFLGSPRDPQIHPKSDTPGPLFIAMSLHAAGVVLVGFWPPAGLRIVRGAVGLFLNLCPPLPVVLPDMGAVLVPVAGASLLLAAVVGALFMLMRRAQAGAATHVTWGCGYSAANTRMQYSGASFSSQFTALFEAVLPQLRKEDLPKGYFPPDGRLATQHVDAVEHRMFQLLGEGEALVARAAGWIPDQPRFAFAAGLAVLAVIVGLIVLGNGGVP
ncbi:MAG: proton-conducting membrane transporter [Elusimicrobia bacterium]|nr:proton-conducting membrane transporter [Elusimicrobiota bacterium]